jgi:hypothetical protein
MNIYAQRATRPRILLVVIYPAFLCINEALLRASQRPDVSVAIKALPQAIVVMIVFPGDSRG